MSTNLSPENEHYTTSAVVRSDFCDRHDRNHEDVLRHLQESIPGMSAVRHLTKDMFGCDPCLELSDDPDFPDWPSIVFHIRKDDPKLSADEVIDLELIWHAQVMKVARDWAERLRLFIE